MSSERISLDTKSLQDGDEELCQRQFFCFYFSSPSGITNDSGTGLVVFIPFTEFEIPAIFETKVLATG